MGLLHLALFDKLSMSPFHHKAQFAMDNPGFRLFVSLRIGKMCQFGYLC